MTENLALVRRASRSRIGESLVNHSAQILLFAGQHVAADTAVDGTSVQGSGGDGRPGAGGLILGLDTFGLLSGDAPRKQFLPYLGFALAGRDTILDIINHLTVRHLGIEPLSKETEQCSCQKYKSFHCIVLLNNRKNLCQLRGNMSVAAPRVTFKNNLPHLGFWSIPHQSCATGTILLRQQLHPRKSPHNLRQLILQGH